jgi:hypothetical protein
MLTGFHRIRDSAAFIDHGNPRAKNIVWFCAWCDCSDLLGKLVVLLVFVDCTSVLDFFPKCGNEMR